MALRIVREISFGLGNKGFHFENQEDEAEDQKQYEEGRALEDVRFREDSLAQKIYERLKRAA
jgi:hypothetical protein